MKCFINYPKECQFPIENLPYGVFSTANDPTHRIGVAIGEFILDLKQISHLFNGPELSTKKHVFKEPTLNSFMTLGPNAWKEARETLQSLLSVDNSILQNNAELRATALVSQVGATMHLPASIGDYTDFYSSIYHASNVGYIFRGKDTPLLPNWKHLPVGYHGRASSVVISETPIRRPNGQTSPVEGTDLIFGPSRTLDFELEMAFFVGGPPTKLGEPINIKDAEKHIFGFVLMNDWSARDIQRWEYVPLGPFTSKNLGTTISPWIVTTLALQPFIVNNFPQDPTPFPYLQHKDNFNFDIKLQVDITPQNSKTPTTVCKSNFKNLYWTPKQQLVHHSVTGCNFNSGDLLGSGTISGESSDSLGCLLESTWGGKNPIHLVDGSQRIFLQDGDTVTLKGVCEGQNFNVGFGTCVGTILPALKL